MVSKIQWNFLQLQPDKHAIRINNWTIECVRHSTFIFHEISIHTKRFDVRIETPITMKFDSMKIFNENAIDGFRLGIDFYSSVRIAFKVAPNWNCLWWFLLLLILTIRFAIAWSDCQSFSISIIAICIWLHIAMKVVYLDFRIIHSLSNSTELRYHCYVCESCRLSFYFWENKKRISYEFLLFPGFFFLSVFLAFFLSQNKSIILLRKPCCCCYYTVYAVAVFVVAVVVGFH